MEQIKVNILDLIPADEGEIDQIYGIIGSGKTYVATSMILDDLKRGQVVYANWKVKWEGYDEREDWFCQFLGVLGLKKTFLKYPKENFHYLDLHSLGAGIHSYLGTLTDCVIYLDEGHIVFDSYMATKMPIQQRANILHTRHFNRKFIIISQRPTAIHVVLRANVNRFFKCEKEFKIFQFIRFKLTEYQDLSDSETVNENNEYSVQRYWGKKKIFEAYNTKYLRGSLPDSQKNYGEIYFLTWKERFVKLFGIKKMEHEKK